jgi:ABC-type branched-subunit amino acid transport system substrate-binding protein
MSKKYRVTGFGIMIERRRKKTKMKNLWVLLTSMALILGLSFAAQSEEGVTDTEIHIGVWGPQTGPAAAWGAIARGTDAYFKLINEEGGIHGRKLILHIIDDAFNPAKTKAGVKELQEGTGIFAWVAGTGTSCGLAVRDYLMEKKVPMISPATGSPHFVRPPHRYIFGSYPLYEYEAKALVRYAVKELEKKRVAIAYLNDDYGKNGLESATEELAKHGMKLVAEVPVEMGDSDMKPHAMKLRKSNADTVLLWVTPTNAVRIVGTGKAIKFTPQWMTTSTCSDFLIMHEISKGLWEGVIAALFAETPDSDHPMMKRYRTAYDKFAAKDERWSVFFYGGMGFAEPLVVGLKRCGRDLTREKFVTTLEGIEEFDSIADEVGYKPFDPDDLSCRLGIKQLLLVQCLEGGKTKKLTDWMPLE